ncbi:MAG: response regulator [Fibromonadaceae bacterium]|jgi:PleD family two-component response regulator|nr:response regulator [Fibromonadaceae bacterium]
MTGFDFMERTLKKIIAVDDVNFFLLSIKQKLQDHYKIYSAQSAENLFEILQIIKPDLILLDINMDGVDGFATIEKLKSDAQFVDIPVIFLTSRSAREDIFNAFSLGAVGFLTKPFSTEKLLINIEKQLDSELLEANKSVILAIDDCPSILKSINHALNKRYKVHTLLEPEKMEEILKTITPDLFLLDYKMPVLNGFELVPIIRSLPAHEATPIIFLTSEATVDNISAAIHYNCDFAVKPVNKVVLHKKIAKQLANFMMRQHMEEDLRSALCKN